MLADQQGTPLPPVLMQWQKTLLGLIGSATPDLTNRQMVLLLVVCLEARPHTASALARRLGLSKPVVTRALNRLSEFRYIKRVEDTNDLRSTLVELTSEGLAFLALLTELLVAN